MECMIAIQKIELPVHGLEILAEEAQAEGYEFIATLLEEWASAENRFDGPGEVFCGHMEGDGVTAVGGLNCDPFAARPDVGRIRKVYVRPAWRGKGVGGALVTHLVGQARQHFRCVRLRAENAGAARLYERLGFEQVDSPDATHMLQF
jgi:GNAT superfamily N-acetyltransferase